MEIGWRSVKNNSKPSSPYTGSTRGPSDDRKGRRSLRHSNVHRAVKEIGCDDFLRLDILPYPDADQAASKGINELRRGIGGVLTRKERILQAVMQSNSLYCMMQFLKSIFSWTMRL
jgi:hypothetical protein